jgi:hypothetical protein
LISATKFESYSNVFTTATLPVRSRSKIRGSLRETNRPSLDAGPGGNGVACGVGVAVGSGEAVAVGGSDTVGVSTGSSVDSGVGSGDVKIAVSVGDGTGVSVGPRVRGVRVGVGVGGGVRAGQPARTAKTTALTATARSTRLRNRVCVFFMFASLIAYVSLFQKHIPILFGI